MEAEVDMTFEGGAALSFIEMDNDQTVMVTLDADTFDVYAERITEAYFNKKGYETVIQLASDARPGDYLGQIKLNNVRPNHPSQSLVTFNGEPFAWMVFNMDLLLEFRRPIQ